MRHFFLFQPVAQPLQFADNRSEPSRLLSRFPLQWPCHYADGQKLFPDINAGASFDCCTDHVRSPFVDWRTVDVFLEYVLPRLNCSIRGCFTSTWPVSFSGQSARHYLLQPPSPVLQWIVLLPHFHLLGWPKPVIPFRFAISHWGSPACNCSGTAIVGWLPSQHLPRSNPSHGHQVLFDRGAGPI